MSEAESSDLVTDEADDPEMTEFDAKLSAAWSEIEAYNIRMAETAGVAPAEEHPAHKHAAAFFDLYLARRPSDIAQYAAQYAFMMMTNVRGGSRLAEAALLQIGDDGKALAGVAQWVIYAHQNDGRREEAETLRERLLAMISSSEDRSVLLIEFAQSAMRHGEYDKARSYCERIIAMNAEESAVKQAHALIYEMDNLNVGQMAPAFEATDTHGNPISLAGLRGKAVLIDFWATWCGPCRGEFPHLRRVNEKFAGDRFMVLSISLDEDCADARKMIEKEKLAWSHVCEGAWHGSRIAELYNVMGIPSTWLIGPDGKIAAKELRGHGADKAVAELLGVTETPAA
jgi:peroxiredoxin